MSIEENIKEVEQSIEDVRGKVKSYWKVRFFIKLIGNVSFVIALILQAWLAAILLWILFFPDLNDFVKFYKNLRYLTKQKSL